MATVKYKDMELEEITESQIFDPPRKCVVWDGDSFNSPCEQDVIAIFPDSAKLKNKVIDSNLYRYQHCAILPEKPAPRRATNRELAKWLAQGNGEVKYASQYAVKIHIEYGTKSDNDPCHESFKIRKWEDTEWHEPTIDYMGIEEAK